MPGPFASSGQGFAQPADAIQAFCRHLGELCDVLSTTYDSEALSKAAGLEKLQETNCNVLLHNALYHWLGERVDLSLHNEGKPEEAAKRARECALAHIQQHGMLANFVDEVVGTSAKTYATAQAPPEPRKSLMFDLQGPIDLLGPEEVDNLLSELATSDHPISALEALSSDDHLLEDLCYGPTWPQFCDALGRLVCLPAAATDAMTSGGGHAGPRAADPSAALPRQQQLLLTVLEELVSSIAASSPPLAAELLDALAPYLTALVLRLPVQTACLGHAEAMSTAPNLLAAATALDPFAGRIMPVVHQLLAGLAAEFHVLPLSCAALAARAVCDVVRAGLAHGAPAPAAAGAMAVRRLDLLVVNLSALDLFVMMDPELRWWQRLCAATHATQPVAVAAAATQMAAALEAALKAWAAAAGGGSGGSYAHIVGSSSCSRSPTHLVACTALLGGLIRANNLDLLALESRDGVEENGSGRGSGAAGGRDHDGGEESSAVARPLRPAFSTAVIQQQRLRLDRMLGHLVTCFCVALDKPWLLRPGGSPSTAVVAATATTAHASPARGGRSVFLILAADVLSVAVEFGWLPLLAPVGIGSSNGSGGGLTALLQAMFRALTAKSSSAVPPESSSSSTTAAQPAWWAAATPEAEAWLSAAVRVLGSAADHAVLSLAMDRAQAAAVVVPPVSGLEADVLSTSVPADVLCSLLHLLAERLRGMDEERHVAAVAVPAVAEPHSWALQVVRAAIPLAAVIPEVSAALEDIYKALHGLLTSRAVVTEAALGAPRSDGSGSGGGSQSPRFPLLGLLDVGRNGCDDMPGAAGRDDSSSHAEPPKHQLAEVIMDEIDLLAAEVVLSYFRTDFGESSANTASLGTGSGQSAVHTSVVAAVTSSVDAIPPLVLQLPTALQRDVFLQCVARRLCQMYVRCSDSAPSGAVCVSAGGSRGRVCSSLCVRGTAIKRRWARQAQALAHSCPGGQHALLAAGFAQLVVNDVASVLRLGQYESPYMEPLPYADPLAGLSAILAQLICWPGLLSPLSEEEEELQATGVRADGLGSRGGQAGHPVMAEGGGGGTSLVLRRQHRRAVLALLQELVTWLDPRGAEGRGLLHVDAALVSLRTFSALVTAHPTSAGAALERDTNIRWYLQNMCSTLPKDECNKVEEQAPGGLTHGGVAPKQRSGHVPAEKQRRPASPVAAASVAVPAEQSDVLLDLARKVLGALQPATTAAK